MDFKCKDFGYVNGYQLNYPFRSGSLVVNHTNIVANTTESAQQFAASIVSLANRTSLDVFGTSTNIEGFAIENIQGNLSKVKLVLLIIGSTSSI